MSRREIDAFVQLRRSGIRGARAYWHTATQGQRAPEWLQPASRRTRREARPWCARCSASCLETVPGSNSSPRRSCCLSVRQTAESAPRRSAARLSRRVNCARLQSINTRDRAGSRDVIGRVPEPKPGRVDAGSASSRALLGRASEPRGGAVVLQGGVWRVAAVLRRSVQRCACRAVWQASRYFSALCRTDRGRYGSVSAACGRRRSSRGPSRGRTAESEPPRTDSRRVREGRAAVTARCSGCRAALTASRGVRRRTPAGTRSAGAAPTQ